MFSLVQARMGVHFPVVELDDEYQFSIASGLY